MGSHHKPQFGPRLGVFPIRQSRFDDYSCARGCGGRQTDSACGSATSPLPLAGTSPASLKRGLPAIREHCVPHGRSRTTISYPSSVPPNISFFSLFAALSSSLARASFAVTLGRAGLGTAWVSEPEEVTCCSSSPHSDGGVIEGTDQLAMRTLLLACIRLY